MPVYAALTQGFVGLYQINFAAPVALPGTPACVPSGTLTSGAHAVRSNLTVSFGGAFSFDGAGICVAVPTASDRSSRDRSDHSSSAILPAVGKLNVSMAVMRRPAGPVEIRPIPEKLLWN